MHKLKTITKSSMLTCIEDLNEWIMSQPIHMKIISHSISSCRATIFDKKIYIIVVIYKYEKL